MFNAIVVNRIDGKHHVALQAVSMGDLDEGDTVVKVEYSTLNYKDGLAVTGASPICQRNPLVAGIDLAGTVVSSTNPEFAAGDRVLINGYGLSERHCGGYAQYARVNSDWLVPVPEVFNFQQTMAIGTAGYTAMLCVMALEQAGIEPSQGPILVTGAAGGVGSVAIALLAQRGYVVEASSGRSQLADYLESLGATRVINRSELEGDIKPLKSERWAGCIDSVGAITLGNVLSHLQYDSAVACCGIAGGVELTGTMIPLILRGVRILGCDSVMAPMARRREAWQRLATDLDVVKLDAMTIVEPLAKVLEIAPQIIAGQIRGRVVIDVNQA